MDRESDEPAGAVAAVLAVNTGAGAAKQERNTKTDGDEKVSSPGAEVSGAEAESAGVERREGGGEGAVVVADDSAGERNVVGEGAGNVLTVADNTAKVVGGRAKDTAAAKEDCEGAVVAGQEAAKDFVISVISVLQKGEAIGNAENAANTETKSHAVHAQNKLGGKLEHHMVQDADKLKQRAEIGSTKNLVDNIIGEQLNLVISHNIVNSSARNIDEETTIESLERDATSEAGLRRSSFKSAKPTSSGPKVVQSKVNGALPSGLQGDAVSKVVRNAQMQQISDDAKNCSRISSLQRRSGLSGLQSPSSGLNQLQSGARRTSDTACLQNSFGGSQSGSVVEQRRKSDLSDFASGPVAAPGGVSDHSANQGRTSDSVSVQSDSVVPQRRTSGSNQSQSGSRPDTVANQSEPVDSDVTVALQTDSSVASGSGGPSGSTTDQGSEESQKELLKGFVTVHVLLDRNKLERVLFSPNQEQQAIVEVLRAASGASVSDVIKLYDQSGRCVQITPDLKIEGQNYHLQVSKYPVLSPNKVTSKFINSELSRELDVILQKIVSLERCLFPLRTGLSKPPHDGLRSPVPPQSHPSPNSSHATCEGPETQKTKAKDKDGRKSPSSAQLVPVFKQEEGQDKDGRKSPSSVQLVPVSKQEEGQDKDGRKSPSSVQLVPVSKQEEGQDGLIKQLEMLSTRIQALTTRANEMGAEWIGCGVGVHCAGAFREQFSRRRISLPKHSEVKAKFTTICNTASSTFSPETLHLLRMPAFDSYAWSDEELLLLLHGMFMELELISTFRIRDGVLRQFLYEVYKHYNEVPFHNFRHCFCVSQMMYSMAWKVDLVSRLGHLEVLVLLVSCICHDLDHPGYNNIYQINARTELAIRYNDISPLENHHCSVAFRILEIPECNILESLPSDTYRQVREGIIRCILATDMARHNEILAQFRDVTPCFDYDNRTHTNLLSMVLIKVADISNEARPLDVAEPWLDRLLQEFFAQSAAEKQEGLPVTPFMDPDKVSKPSSQVRFIGLVLLPLFEALGEHMPELQDLIVQPVRDALEYYRRLNEATKEGRSRKSLGDGLEPAHQSHNLNSPTGSQSTHSGRSRRSLVPRMSLSISRSIENNADDNQQIDHSSNKSITPETHNQHIPSTHDIERFIKSRGEDSEELNMDGREIIIDDDFEEENDSGDSETATEVEVSEKTLKFKIATEGGGSSSDRRNSRIGIPSRKNSHERCTLSHAAYSLDLQKYDYRRGSLGPSSSGGSLGNFCSNCQAMDTNRCCRGRNSDGSVRSPCSDICQRSQGSVGSHSVRQISEEFEPEADDKTDDKQIEVESIKIVESKVEDKEEEKSNKIEESSKEKLDELPIKRDANIVPNSNQDLKQNFDEIIVEKTSASQQEESIQQQPQTKSLFARIKQFTDRITLSFDKQYSRNNNTSTQSDDVFQENLKASTLPKSKRIEAKRTWKILMYNKDKTTNSVDVLTDVDSKSTEGFTVSKDIKDQVEI